MAKIILTENQLRRLVETGSNSAAMDLDIYIQPVHFDTSTGNESMEESIDEIVHKLQEIKSSFKTGKKTKQNVKTRIFQILDNLKDVYNIITEKP